MPATMQQVDVKKIKPLDDRVLIEVSNSNAQTAGGIFIPDSAQEKPQQGKVIAVGPGRVNDAGQRQPLNLKVGDYVMFQKYGGTDLRLADVDYKVLSERDILFVIEQ